MNLKHRLTAATALTLIFSSGAAFAGNSAALNQNGSSNTGTVTQSGDKNVAGTATYGVGQYDLYQNGDSNNLVINQSGNGNNIGTSNAIVYSGTGYAVPASQQVASPYLRPQLGGNPYGHGVDQYGNFNSLTVDQVEGSSYANGNLIGTVEQNASNAATALTNSLHITQDNGDGGLLAPVPYPGPQAYNYVGDVYQNNSSAGASALDANTATIAQHTAGLDGYNRGNRLDVFTQDGHANNIDILEVGRRNIINYAEQTGTGNSADVTMRLEDNYIRHVEQDGTNQTATINITGMGNGANGFSGIVAAQTGAPASSVVQQDGTGSGGNMVNLQIPGNYNEFGIFQSGTSNDVGSLTLAGDSNELGVWQMGTTNQLHLSTVSGDSNDIGVYQDGTSNESTITVPGSDNLLATAQWGDLNFASLDIGGNGNYAGVF